jgi:hypothetical protein
VHYRHGRQGPIPVVDSQLADGLDVLEPVDDAAEHAAGEI